MLFWNKFLEETEDDPQSRCAEGGFTIDGFIGCLESFLNDCNDLSDVAKTAVRLKVD